MSETQLLPLDPQSPPASNGHAPTEPEQERQAEEECDFSWSAIEDSVVIQAQPAIAIYFNRRDEVVIRQESQFGDEDHFVYVRHENLRLLIARLQQIERGDE